MPFPLYRRLLELNRRAAELWPTDFDVGFAHLGLMLSDEPAYGDYDWCTPTNSRAFAWTGGEGVHFSFVLHEEIVTPSSPVIVTTPANMGNSHVVGENLHDFLCLGCLRGYFGIEQIESEEYQRAFGDPHWIPATDEDGWYGFGSDETKEAMLSFLRSEMDLIPWNDPCSRLTSLERRFASRLNYPEGFLD